MRTRIVELRNDRRHQDRRRQRGVVLGARLGNGRREESDRHDSQHARSMFHPDRSIRFRPRQFRPPARDSVANAKPQAVAMPFGRAASQSVGNAATPGVPMRGRSAVLTHRKRGCPGDSHNGEGERSKRGQQSCSDGSHGCQEPLAIRWPDASPGAARVNPGQPVWLSGPIRCGRRRAGGPPELAV